MTRRLPVLVERTLAETKASQIGLETDLRATLGEVTCQKGCANCCSHAVYVTIPEGVLIYQNLAKQGLWTPSLRQKLEAHAERTWDLDLLVWHLSNIPCPLLLPDNTCSVYQARPFSCRSAWSKDDPANCHPHVMRGLIPRAKELQAFQTEQDGVYKRHGLRNVQISLSKAVLLGAKIASGEIEIEQSYQVLLREAK